MTSVTEGEWGREGETPSSRVDVLVGTRPEAIKMAPVAEALRTRHPHLATRVVLTGQHSELVDEALHAFGVVPEVALGIMREGQTVSQVGERCLAALAPLLEDGPPGILLVQGDTASAFFGALAAFLHKVPVGHVEAGLRSGDLHHPFPEEGFRRLAGVLAELHFAPTALARANLLGEGVPAHRIHLTGNTVVDALHRILADAPDRGEGEWWDGVGARILLTAHRRESFGAPLERVFGAVRDLLERHPHARVLYPVHPNPNVREPAHRILGDHPRIELTAPLPYGVLAQALARADLILTDSGGIQEEAPTFGTPVLVLREVTERPEGVEAGVAWLVGTDPKEIGERADALLAEGEGAREGRKGRNPYGDGRAGERIADQVAAFLAERGGGAR